MGEQDRGMDYIRRLIKEAGEDIDNEADTLKIALRKTNGQVGYIVWKGREGKFDWAIYIDTSWTVALLKSNWQPILAGVSQTEEGALEDASKAAKRLSGQLASLIQ